MPDPAHEFPPSESGPTGSFPTTQWSLVLHAGAGSESQARCALESLCRQYWYPLYGFIRRQGRNHHEAEDCTQEFLARLLANQRIERARPERGRFRTFLLAALRNFLINDWQRAHAAKRGGGQAALSLDLETADQRFSHEPADPGLTPEQAFDRSWAHGLFNHAVAALRAEYAKQGQLARFEALAPVIWGNDNPATLAQQAALVGLSGPNFSVALHRVRRRLGERLRTTVAETVAGDADIDAELRHLIAAVGSGAGT